MTGDAAVSNTSAAALDLEEPPKTGNLLQEGADGESDEDGDEEDEKMFSDMGRIMQGLGSLQSEI